MNIQAIKRNCLARRVALLLTNPSGAQLVFNGQTAYPVEGLRLDAEGLEALFNLSVKQRDNMLIAEKPNDDGRFSTLRGSMGEEEVREIGRIVYYDSIYIALASWKGMLYIPLDPIRHIKEDYRAFAVRWKDGAPVVVVYGNLFVEAVCVPLGNRDAEKIQEIAGRMAAPGYRWPDEERDAADAEAEAERIAGEMGIE